LQIQLLLQRYGINNHENVSNLNNLNINQEKNTRTDNYRERNERNNSSTSDIDDFLKESSIRDRLRRLPSIQDMGYNSTNNISQERRLINDDDSSSRQLLIRNDRFRTSSFNQEMDQNSSQERTNELRYRENNINHSSSNYLTNNHSYIQEENHNVVQRINLYDNSVNQIISNTRFRQTLKEIIMVPYIENNKTVSKGSQMYVYLIVQIILRII